MGTFRHSQQASRTHMVKVLITGITRRRDFTRGDIVMTSASVIIDVVLCIFLQLGWFQIMIQFIENTRLEFW